MIKPSNKKEKNTNIIIQIQELQDMGASKEKRQKLLK